jgi:hypothetical protein
MAEDPKMIDASGSGHEAEREEALALPSQADIEEVQVPAWSTLRSLQERRERFEISAAGRYWAHLSTADFMNSSFAFAALAVLSAFPFLAVSSSVVGVDIRTAIVARMGLNPQATRDINGLIATGNHFVYQSAGVAAFTLYIVSASSPRSSSPTRSPQGRRAMALPASS